MTRNATRIGRPIDRRTLLQLAAATGGSAALGWLGVPSAQTANAQAAEAEITVADPRYNKIYKATSTYYINDPQWTAYTRPRLTWPEAGEKVPELSVMIPTVQQTWLDSWRKWAADGEKLGLKYNLQQVSEARWLDSIDQHKHGDIEMHPAILRPERVDPSEWLVSRAYGLDRRDYGEWTNKQYDALIDAQAKESDAAKRLKLIQDAQRILADDLYIAQCGWGPAVIEAYNSDAWDNLVKSRGFGVGSFNAFHSFLQAKPKTARRRMVVGMQALLETTNIIAAGNNMRSIGRMIYDRLAYLDADLKIIPWAAESWTRVDERTWDIKLRSGMTFHDGKPVTVQDLQFTFDFMLKWERSIFWTANQFLESTKITDEENGVLRAVFKQPYGQFESYFLQLNVILPKHIWQNIMTEQGVGDDPRRLRIDKPIGSGPFSFGRYTKESQLQLSAHKSHFSKPSVDEVWIVVTPTIDGLLGRLESQEIDLIESSDTHLSPSQAKQLEKSPHITIVRTPDLNWLHCVPRVSNLPWRDVEFRRAWHHSFDREFLVKVVWEGAGRAPLANTFLVEGSPWNNPDLPSVPPFDLDKAREILKAAGYSWASDGRLCYPAATDETFRRRVEQVCKEGYAWGGLKMLG
jgi:peptide/nickel transport system substrate-binding protein